MKIEINDYKIITNIFFDSKSHCFFILNDLVKKLNLFTSNTEAFQFCTFGATQPI